MMGRAPVASTTIGSSTYSSNRSESNQPNKVDEYASL